MNFYNKVLKEGVQKHKDSKFDEALAIYSGLLSRQLNNVTLLYLAGDAFLRKEWTGIAIQFFSRVIQLDKKHLEAWQDLGVALKKEFYNAEAEEAWLEALKIKETPELYTNLASLYSDYGRPDKGLEYTNKALALKPDCLEAHWNRALALLSKQDWEEGWQEHEYRKNLDSYNERTKLEIPEWDGSPGKSICVTGEQGVGDEIMFASCLPDLQKISKHLVIECEKRLIPVFKRSFGPAYASQDDVLEDNPPLDARVAFGSLPKFFRNKDSDFPREAYLKPDPKKVKYFKKKLAKLGKPPYIGLSWTGGTKPTRIHERSLPVSNFARFQGYGTCISLQYGIFAENDAKKVNLAHWPGESDGTDIDNLLALCHCLDVIVTVATTVVHAAGSVGAETHVLLPFLPSWRYNGEDMPWYANTHLHRQVKMGDWDYVLDSIDQALHDKFVA